MSTRPQYYPVMARLGLAIHEYPARAQLMAERVVSGIAMWTELVDGKAKPCHDGVFGASPADTVP